MDVDGAAGGAGGAGASGGAGAGGGAEEAKDIKKAEGYHLLSDKEKELCRYLQLLPKHYVFIKNVLIRECLKHGFLKKGAARSLIKIDVNKTSKIYDFFVSSGWIPKEGGDAEDLPSHGQAGGDKK